MATGVHGDRRAYARVSSSYISFQDGCDRDSGGSGAYTMSQAYSKTDLLRPEQQFADRPTDNAYFESLNRSLRDEYL